MIETNYQAEQIRRFLKAVDKHLTRAVRLVVIGGGAALLQHGARSPTRDIDAFDGDPSLLRDAVALAEAELGSRFRSPVRPERISRSTTRTASCAQCPRSNGWS